MAKIQEVSYSPEIKVQIVDYSEDLAVFVTKNEYEANNSDSVWFFGTNGGKKIQFVNYSPDLKIKYVHQKYEAGWKNHSHRLQNRIM